MANPKRFFNVDDYYGLYEAGIITEDDRVELVEGEIVEMAAKGISHVACVRRITAFLYRNLASDYVINVQDPVRINDTTELEPDVAILRPREDDYTSEHPVASDVLLLIEVSDTTLAYDRGVKSALYARAGIREYWVVNLPNEVIETYTQPTGSKYKVTGQAIRGDFLTPRNIPGLSIKGSDILG